MNETRGLPISGDPEWLALIPDYAGETVSVRVEHGLARVLLTRSNGQNRTVYLRQEGATVKFLDRSSKTWQPCPQQTLTRVASFTAAERRAAWVQGTLLGERSAGVGAAPPERVLRLAADYAHLEQLAQPERTQSAPPARVETSESLKLYFAVLRADWELVFAAESSAPSWVQPLVSAVTGDLARLRETAASLPEVSSPLAVFKGLALDALGFPTASLETLKLGLAALDPQTRAIHYVPFAAIAAACGHTRLAVSCLAWAASVRRHDDHLLARITTELIRLGAFAEAAQGLEQRAKRQPEDLRTLVALADFGLWTGQVASAQAWIERANALAADDTDVLRLGAVLAAFVGNRTDALERLQHPSLSDNDEALTWQAELLAETDPVRANELLSRAKTRAHTPLHALIQCQIDGASTNPTAVAFLAKYADPALPRAAQIREVMKSFHGNRGRRLTRTPSNEPARPGQLEQVAMLRGDVEVEAREAAAGLLKTLRSSTLEAVQVGFPALIERYPESPHPWCYWGELWLWLGEFSRAAECFNQPVARRARWAFVGRAAVHVHAGDYDAALEEFAECARVMDPVHGATTHVYLGELYRLRGEYERATAELDIALDAKASRLGARLNRYLCWLHTDRVSEALAGVQTVQESYPWLARECGLALGHRDPLASIQTADRAEAICLKMLELMRGNRSSHTITFFDNAGQLRMAHDAAHWRKFAREHRELVKSHLLREMLIV